MVINLKQSMMDGMKLRILRYSIKRVEDNRGTFLFGMEFGVPYILYLEDGINETMGVMILLEEFHCPTGVGAKVYFNELETRLKNGILVEKNGN